jgi:hypothetical protein
MIRLTQTALLWSDTDITSLAREFQLNGCAILPGFWDSNILATMVNSLKDARFVVKNEQEAGRIFGTTLFVPDAEPALELLHFLLNRPVLFRIVEQVTGSSTLRNFIGRIHRTNSGAGHHIDWHDDAVSGRTSGICVNLGTEPYSGGLLQLRDIDKKIRAEVRFTAPGDAVLFQIDRGWQHRLTPVESGRRTVGVGWFRTEPEWQPAAINLLRLLLKESNSIETPQNI